MFTLAEFESVVLVVLASVLPTPLTAALVAEAQRLAK
jgi:hypothetical protein